MMSHYKLSRETLNSSTSDQATSSLRREKDRISQLPQELIHCILSHLNLRDAVKTSVLSHRWKHVYLYPSHLQFDRDTIQPQFRDSCENSCILYKEKFVGAINQFLRFYQGSKLSFFTVKYCLGQKWKNDIDRWVRFALSQAVEILTLDFYCNKFCASNYKHKTRSGLEGKYVLENELIEGLETSNLKHLDLVGCNLGKNFTFHFTCLESLRLSYLPLSLHHLNSLFASLKKLKILTFKRCTVPTKLCLKKLPLLERLAIWRAVGLKEIEFLNVNLVEFSCICPGNTISFDLTRTPNLSRFSYSVHNLELQQFFYLLLKALPNLGSLHVCAGNNWVKFVPETISVFPQVRSLTLFLIHEEFHALKIISILSAFPHLLTLSLSTTCIKDFNEELMMEVSKYVPKHLKMVEMRGFRSTPNQIEFAISLLRNASALEQLIIKSELLPQQVPPTQPWDETERRMVAQRLQKFAKDKIMLFVG